MKIEKSAVNKLLLAKCISKVGFRVAAPVLLIKVFAKLWTVSFLMEYLKMTWQTNENMQACFKPWEQQTGIV